MPWKVVIDSDALIKLTKAGLLPIITHAWQCLIPDEVYEEVVVRGKREAHPDAAEIERFIGRGLERGRVRAAPRRISAVLGPGERAVVALFGKEQADLILTDDRAFLATLRQLGLPHLTPALALVKLAEQGAMSLDQAQDYLDRLKPLIRSSVYEAARADLQKLI
jgi:predicted nucleic acid-binding protein